MKLTEVVLTPQSNSGVVGEGAGGVSTHSKFSSEVLLLILPTAEQFCKMQVKVLGELVSLTAVNLPKRKRANRGYGWTLSPSPKHSTAHRRRLSTMCNDVHPHRYIVSLTSTERIFQGENIAVQKRTGGCIMTVKFFGYHDHSQPPWGRPYARLAFSRPRSSGTDKATPNLLPSLVNCSQGNYNASAKSFLFTKSTCSLVTPAFSRYCSTLPYLSCI